VFSFGQIREAADYIARYMTRQRGGPRRES
jgi:hypothetical protein